PYILGSVATLLLLDDLDEGGLRALSVSPLGVRGYLSYRTVSTALAALFAVIAATLIAGPPAGTGWQRLGPGRPAAAGRAGAGPSPPRAFPTPQGARVRGLESLCHRLLPPAGRLGAAPVATCRRRRAADLLARRTRLGRALPGHAHPGAGRVR